MTTITKPFGAYVAHIEPMVGIGLLVEPILADDVANPDPTNALSVHEVDWNTAMAHLAHERYELLPDHGSLGLMVGITTDGRHVFGLGGEPLDGRYDDDLEAASVAWLDLAREVGVTLYS